LKRLNLFYASLVALLLLSLANTGFGPLSTTSQAPKPDSFIYLRASGQDNFYRVPPPVQARTPVATIIVNYQGTWTPQAQAAFQHAVDIWASIIQSSVPIMIEAEWTALPSGVLGGAGPADYARNFPAAPQSNTWYPIALANALAGSDLSPSYPDVDAVFNSNFSDWYFGTDGNPPSGRYDFTSVVLHEIGHGLGFSGTADVSGNLGSWGSGTSSPDIFDRFPENAVGQTLFDFPNYSAALADQLTGGGGGLFFDGPNAVAGNGGAPPKLYAPYPWENGSSYAHLDENTFDNTPHALMTPSIGSGEALHNPGAVTLGIFQDLGWPLTNVPQPEPNLSVRQTAPDTNVIPGQAVTITITVENNGDATATSIVLTNTLPTEILTPTWSTNSPDLAGATERGGAPHVWDLPDLAPGSSGTVAVMGTISPGLTGTFAIINQVTIRAAEAESSSQDNESMIILGGFRVYLPFISK
jgi:uncharacterized repeat protein (TIGR01451 family)